MILHQEEFVFNTLTHCKLMHFLAPLVICTVPHGSTSVMHFQRMASMMSKLVRHLSNFKQE